MFTLEKAANEASLMNISNVLFEDAEAMKWLAFYSNSSKWHKTHSSNIFTLILKEESNDAGFVELEFSSDGTQVVISFYLAPDFRGKGRALSFLQSTFAWLKANSRANVVFAYADVENLRSLRLLDKANFRYETKRENMMCFVTIIN